MLKVKISKIGLMILTSVFCLFLSGVAAEKECWDSLGGGPTFTGNHNYPSGWFPEFQYDPNNPDEIDRNSSVEISVIGGFPPYTWQVSGNGFSIPSSTTDGTNTLSADGTACGTATITVTDVCGDSCTGYVRCTTGKWVIKQSANIDACVLPGVGTSSSCGAGCTSYVLIVGYQKQVQVTYSAGGCGFEDPVSCCECDICCNPDGSGCAGWACLPCIDYNSEVGYTVPYYNMPGPPPYSRKCRNTQLIYSEWEC